jgi:methionine-rich copper-binding protein CopC
MKKLFAAFALMLMLLVMSTGAFAQRCNIFSPTKMAELKAAVAALKLPNDETAEAEFTTAIELLKAKTIALHCEPLPTSEINDLDDAIAWRVKSFAAAQGGHYSEMLQEYVGCHERVFFGCALTGTLTATVAIQWLKHPDSAHFYAEPNLFTKFNAWDVANVKNNEKCLGTGTGYQWYYGTCIAPLN